MEITTKVTRPVGTLVRYHGSIRRLHGELFVITHNYVLNGRRYVAAEPAGLPLNYSLSNASQTSFSIAETL